jgi:GR25 family glycosyltransferase involved in LPS biosynthesis
MSDLKDRSSVIPATDDEAAWHSLWQRSRALRDAGQEEEFVRTALDAFRQRPHRAEPLHDLARYYLGKSRGDIAIVYADAGMALPLPKEDRIGVEEDIYRFQLKEAFAIAASFSKDPDEKERGRAVCNWLSMNKALPHSARALARQNSRWFAEPINSLLPSVRFKELPVAAPEGYKPGNISIAQVDDGFVALVRAVNYDFLESGFFDRHGDTSFRQRVLLLRLDRNLEIIGSEEVLPPDDLPPPRHIDSLGFEDPRPIVWRNQLWCLSCMRQLNEEGRAEMVFARIAKGPQGQTVFTDWRVLVSGRPARWEKNWMTQVVGDELRFVYSVDPTRVITESGQVPLDEEAPIAVDNLLGGSQAVPFDGGWLMLVHEWELVGRRRNYFHRFIWLDAGNRLARLSRRFFFVKPSNEFAAGLAWHATGDRLVVSFGIDDHSPTLAIIAAQEVRTALLDIDEHERACERASQAGREALDALLIPSTASARPEDDPRDPLDMSQQVHLINLDRSPQRLLKFRRRNPHLDNVLRFPAVDGALLDNYSLIREGVVTEGHFYSPGSLGCSLSHMNLWKKAVSENRVVTVFEDDAVCSENFGKESTDLVSRLPEDWDIVLWGFDFWPKFAWLDFGLAKAKLEFYGDRSLLEDYSRFQAAKLPRSPVRIAHVLGVQAYSISPKGARALLEYCLPIRKRFIPFPGTNVAIKDEVIDCAMCGAYSSMQAFACFPPLVIQDCQQASDRVKGDHPGTQATGPTRRDL